MALSDRSDHLSLNRFDFESLPIESVTLFFPRILGGFFPDNSRWSQWFDSEHRVWINSLHIGTCVLIASLVGWWHHRSFISIATLTVATIAMASSLGDQLPLNGLYGIWCDWLPLYSSFRYPAKWTVILAWALTLMAAYALSQLNRIRQESPQKFNRIVNHLSTGWLGLLVASMVVLVVHFSLFASPLRERFYTIFQSINADPWCGPFEPAIAIRDIGRTGLIGLLTCGMLYRFSSRCFNQSLNPMPIANSTAEPYFLLLLMTPVCLEATPMLFRTFNSLTLVTSSRPRSRALLIQRSI